jgi:hypothetical protein
MTPPPPPPPPAAAAAPAVRPRRTGRSAPSRSPTPRRVSGPASRKPTAPKATAKTAARAVPRGGAVALPAPGGFALGLLDALAGISKQRWLDRLIHGRAWIAVVAFALIGIVAMQLWVVKLGVGIGRALEHEGLLQRENATLSIEDAQLSSGERVEQLAAARGMVVASPGALRFDTSRDALDARLAAAALARGGQATASSSSSTTATSEAEASASSAGATTSTATSSAGAEGTESGESPTATSAGSTATASTPEGASGSEAAAATTPTAEGSADTTATAPAAGGSPSGEPAPAPSAPVGEDGGTTQPTPGG